MERSIPVTTHTVDRKPDLGRKPAFTSSIARCANYKFVVSKSALVTATSASSSPLMLISSSMSSSSSLFSVALGSPIGVEVEGSELFTSILDIMLTGNVQRETEYKERQRDRDLVIVRMK
jgi:hypothetical protein